jgi:hypothetical protein
MRSENATLILLANTKDLIDAFHYQFWDVGCGFCGKWIDDSSF